MRKFIISDIHGNGDIYDTIISYLDSISKEEKVELYINGDLIDRGFDSFRVLMDVVERINGKGNVSIHYLGGNHEQLMYWALRERLPGCGINPWSDWISSGGYYIEGELDSREDGEILCDYFRDFMGNLKIYQLFQEKIQDKPILLVHAKAPKKEILRKDLRIKDDNQTVFDALWTRKEKRGPSVLMPGKVIGFNRIGSDDFFTIRGHTRANSSRGFDIDLEDNYMNIDGGCGSYAMGLFPFDKVPLIEIKDDYLEILVFNHNNEIIDGYYYDGNLISMPNDMLMSERKKLNPQFNGQEKVYQKEILHQLEE